MRKWALYILLIILQLNCSKNISFAQTLFHQDIFYGGVTAGGVSGGMGYGTYNLQLHIEPGSTIRHAYLFAYTIKNPEDVIYKINNFDFKFSKNTSSLIMIESTNSVFDTVRLYYSEVTKEINDNITNEYVITIPNQTNSEINEGWWAVYLYIEYDNPSLAKIATSLWINDTKFENHNFYNMANMNAIDLNHPVGLSLMTDRLCNAINDGNKVYVNNHHLGIIGGIDAVNANANCGGTKGHFYYQNNQLYGLDDDTPDLIMENEDALADISSYLINNNSYDLKIEYQSTNTSNAYSNINLLFINAYTTPCDTFTTSISKDTAICKGGKIMLHANGGTKYHWYSANGLSDTIAANPIVNPDKTTLYQVRIENTPGCSKTENVLVKVHEKPKINSLAIHEADCGAASGSVTVNASANTSLKYTLDSVFQNNKSFYNLGGGSYTLIIKDTNGCTTDTTLNIPIKNNVQAFFTATPQEGAKPLFAYFNNESQSAINYQWFINNNLLSNTTNENSVFDSSGIYTVTLVAWNNDISCTDTFKLKITVYNSLIIQIPNIFTPNNDGVNDIFAIKIEGCKRLKGFILNRWGESLVQFDKAIDQNSDIIDLWNGKSNNGANATEGVFFYRIRAIDINDNIKELSGFFHLMR